MYATNRKYQLISLPPLKQSHKLFCDHPFANIEYPAIFDNFQIIPFIKVKKVSPTFPTVFKDRYARLGNLIEFLFNFNIQPNYQRYRSRDGNSCAITCSQYNTPQSTAYQGNGDTGSGAR